MAEYLAPGVFIEEIPAHLKAIEGVSTSTTGLVGMAERGPVPGFPLPFTPGAADPQVVTITADPTPVLVTSFSEFTRTFGDPLPLPDPDNNAYLGYAARAFFDNGGKRCYVSRVLHFDPTAGATGNATYGALRLEQGTVLRLARPTLATDQTLFLASLRRVDVGATSSLAFFHKNGTPVLDAASNPLTAQVNGYDARQRTVALSAAVGVVMDASDVFAVPGGVTLNAAGPVFWARTPGEWSARLSVVVTPTDRAAVPVLGPAPALATEIRVQSTSSFYRGAVIEIDRNATPGGVPAGGGTQRTYHVVRDITGGGRLVLDGPVGTAVPAATASANASARVAEIDISIIDPSPAVPVVETFRALTWNPDKAVRLRHYATVINARSQLAYVQPPGVGGLGGSEAGDIRSQPTTFNGLPVSIETASGPLAGAQSAVTAAAAAAAAAVAAIQALVTGGVAAFPLPSTDPLVVAANAAATAATAAATAATTAGGTLTGPAAGLATDVTNAGGAATAAAAAATAAAATATASPTAATAAADLAANLASAQTAATTATAAQTAVNTAVGAAGTVLGSDGNLPLDADYVGRDDGPGHRSGIQALVDASDVSIIAAPGRTDAEVQNELIAQCERLRYRFAVLDGEQDPAGGSVNAILTHRDSYDTSFAAYYVPWVQITVNDQVLSLPPSGYVAGIYARTDNDRGVWKAPANEVVLNVTGLKTYMTTGEQEILNPRGVNVIRWFEGRGIRVWGARTLSSDPEFKYVNVRRFLIFMEASIDRGTQWVVFEPNSPETWGRVVDSVSAFLDTQWRSGALFGRKPEDSYFVRCDETTMTADDVQNGRLICHIGVAIVRPAEFVIFRIEQITGFGKQ